VTRLDGRVHVVTGATGMAADAARRFAELGADVVVVAKDRDECEALGLPHEIADLTDEAAAVRAFAAARDRHGRLDAVYAVAGGSGRRLGDGPLHETSLAAWSATVDLNLTPAFLAVREAVRAMLSQDPDATGSRGSVVVMTSVLAFDPAPSLFATHAYAAAKAAAVGMVRATAAYYAPHTVRINALAPSLVTTPMSARAAADPTSVEFSRAKQPLTGGFLDPADVTAAAVWLCGPDSRAVTGQVLTVDGGWSVSGEHR
jgi:NAD(P)-dependent dehydrogenase (short-subunit alcohol dehydrogenase family)